MALSYDVTGDGPTLVLLHAGVCDRRMWDAQRPALTAAGYRLVCCDLRGFGDTPAPDRPHNDAEDVRDLLDTLGVRQVGLVGASYGGRAALEFAARWPDRVDALALICSAMPDHEPSAALRALGAREDALIEAGDLAGAAELMVETWVGPAAGEDAREAVRVMQQRAYEVQLAAPEEFGRRVAEFDLTAIKAPCLAVSGRHDLADFREIAAGLPDLLADARHVELPWAAHLPSLERPSALDDLLVGFLRETMPVG